MHATFSQKILLTIIVAMVLAAVIQWARLFVDYSQEAIGEGIEHRTIVE